MILTLTPALSLRERDLWVESEGVTPALCLRERGIIGGRGIDIRGVAEA